MKKMTMPIRIPRPGRNFLESAYAVNDVKKILIAVPQTVMMMELTVLRDNALVAKTNLYASQENAVKPPTIPVTESEPRITKTSGKIMTRPIKPSRI